MIKNVSLVCDYKEILNICENGREQMCAELNMGAVEGGHICINVHSFKLRSPTDRMN
jgi:hypothetical protein